MAIEITYSAIFGSAQRLHASMETSVRDIPPLEVVPRRLGAILRKAVWQHFGKRSEKQAEFGLQPFRGRKAIPPPEPSPASTNR